MTYFQRSSYNKKSFHEYFVLLDVGGGEMCVSINGLHIVIPWWYENVSQE